MAKEPTSQTYFRPIRRILVGLLVAVLLGLFLLWRIDSPRVESFRIRLIDKVVPSFAWASAPATALARMAENYQSYRKLFQQNQDLRRELQQMKSWKEAALQLEQKNARLLDLNKVRLDPKFTYVTGVVLADSGSPFRQSVLVNVGARDGIRDGWAAMDGLGLVGRISGVGQRSARVILLTDSNSRIPVTIQPSGQKAILTGDNTLAPLVEFLEKPEDVRPGDIVISSGDGGVFPPGLMVGRIAQGRDQRLRARLVADFRRLSYLRILRARPVEALTDPGAFLVPPTSRQQADMPGQGQNPKRQPVARGGGNG